MAQTRQQKELITLAALVVVAGLAWYFYFGRSIAPNTGVSASGVYTPIDAQDYAPILGELDKAQHTEYKSSGRNIFTSAPIPVEAAGPAAKVKPAYVVYNQPSLPPPPPAPELPWKFFGYGMLPAGGPRQAFLQEVGGDEVHIVSEGEVVLNHLRILRIGNERIEFEDTNTGLRGSKTLEAAPTA